MYIKKQGHTDSMFKMRDVIAQGMDGSVIWIGLFHLVMIHIFILASRAVH